MSHWVDGSDGSETPAEIFEQSGIKTNGSETRTLAFAADLIYIIFLSM